MTVQIQLDGLDPSKCVGIGAELKGGIRRELICFLKRNKSTFAWTTEDMPEISIDFTDLNKACPKDSFPLPHIDQLVEATGGHKMLSFMDAFS